MTKGSYTLRGQLGLLFAALAVPLLLLHVWWSYHDYQSARERAWTDALAFADAVDLGVRQFMEQSEDLLRSSARRSGADWLTDGACSDDMRSLRELLPFENVLVVRTEGWIVCSAATVPPDATAAAWPWFDELLRTGEALVGPPVEAEFTGSWILPLVAPIHDADGRLQGALVGTVPLTHLSTLLGGFRPPEEQLTTLATADRVIIARSVDAAQWIGRNLPPPTGSDRLVAPGRWVATGPDLTGVERTWGQVRTESGWIVYVGIPDTVVFGPALQEAATHVGGTLLVVLLALLLGALSYSRIAGSLRQLADKTSVSEAGEIGPVPRETPKEVTAVIEQFNETLKGRTRAEAAERAARERFQSLFDNAVFGIYVSTADGRFLQVNPALVEMLGYDSAETLMDVGPEALYADPEVRRRLVARDLRDESGTLAPQELEWLRADGTPIIVRVGGKMIEGPHGEPAFEMIVQDITEEKRTEDQLRQTQKMEAIGQLAGGVAHDFNNLLTVISGNVELLEDDIDPSDPVHKELEQISRATQRASSLTRRLLSFSRPTRRGITTLDLNEVVPDLTKMLAPIIGETVVLRTELEEDPLPVTIDAGELEQLVVNLVLNARDALGGEGEIVVTAGASDEETDEGVRRGVTLAVTDDGVGMDTDTQQRIFEPFYTTKAMGEGTGLGLATVYGIVQRAGGTIAVDSEPDRGTRMEIWLPRATETPAKGSPLGDFEPTSHGESILVVEDDELVRTFVRRALLGWGFDVHIASSGDEALDYLDRRDDPVDLVVTDVVMPGLTGPELADRLSVEAPGTPVIFMSGYIDDELFGDTVVHRPDALLNKPFTLQELHEHVRKALDQISGSGVGVGGE